MAQENGQPHQDLQLLLRELQALQQNVGNLQRQMERLLHLPPPPPQHLEQPPPQQSNAIFLLFTLFR
jgi:hypothetical protein